MISINTLGQNENENAIKLFESKKFKEALPFFQETYKKYPENKNISYYLGVCLVETGQFNIENSKLLLLASKGDIPNDVNFFIGKNYHALNKFQYANAYYQKFINTAKKRKIKESGVKELLDLSNKRINPFEKSTNESLASIRNENIDTIPEMDIITPENEIAPDKVSEKLQTDSNIQNNGEKTPSSLKEIVFQKDNTLDSVSIPQELIDSFINFNISTEIVYLKFNQFRTIKGKSHFLNGWEYSNELKKIIEKTNELRKEYEMSDSYDVKNQLSNKVLNLEGKIFELKNLSDKEYQMSRESENSFWQTVHVDEISKFKKENDSILVSTDNRNPILEFEEELPIDSITIQDEKEELIKETLSQETLISNSIIPKLKSEVIYKIQIGAFKTELPPASKNLFKKLSVLRKIETYTDEKNITYYTIGELTNFKDALKLQDQIRKESIKDAFIIIFKDGKKLSFNEAKQYFK